MDLGGLLASQEEFAQPSTSPGCGDGPHDAFWILDHCARESRDRDQHIHITGYANHGDSVTSWLKRDSALNKLAIYNPLILRVDAADHTLLRPRSVVIWSSAAAPPCASDQFVTLYACREGATAMRSVLKFRSCACSALNFRSRSTQYEDEWDWNYSRNVPDDFFVWKRMYLYCLKQNFGVRIVAEVVTNRLGEIKEIGMVA